MQQGWRPIKSFDHLFSEKMATKLGQELAHRADDHDKRKQQDLRYGLELGEATAGKTGKAESKSLGNHSGESVQKFLKEAKFDQNPSDPTPYPEIEYPMVVAPRSCVSSFGPYNNWGNQEGGGGGEVSLAL